MKGVCYEFGEKFFNWITNVNYEKEEFLAGDTGNDTGIRNDGYWVR
jgi:hypothetical protein